jgi:steroid delta-isomerase-like uncharacterized protein
MSPEDAKAAVQGWIEAFNGRDFDASAELVAPEYVRHDANLPDVVGPQAEIEFLKGVLAAFPDLHFTVEQMVIEDGIVVTRLQGRGTHQGEFLGVQPTGRTVSLLSMETYRVADGKLVEQWVVMDALGLLQQLGGLPPAP